MKFGRLLAWILGFWLPAAFATLSLLTFLVTFEVKNAVFFVVLAVLAFLGWAYCGNMEKS